MSISAQAKRKIRIAAQGGQRGLEDADDELRSKGGAVNDLVFLGRWKARAAKRRVQIADELSAMTFGPQRKENLKIWLKNLQARRMWLEARLEHFKSVEDIVASVIERN
jgi:hypothetical protein